MKRRSFVVLTAFASIGIVINFSSCNRSISKINFELAPPRSLMQIMSDDLITCIGRVYIKMFPYENTIEILGSLLTERETLAYYDNLLENEIKEKIKQNFRRNEIVIVNGWILALTEARQAALFSLV